MANKFAQKRVVAVSDLAPNGLIALTTAEYAERFFLSASAVWKRIHKRKVLATKNKGVWKIIILEHSKDGLGIPYYVPSGVNRNR
jgi:hypothetical protein